MNGVVWFKNQTVALSTLTADVLDRAWRYGDGGFETLYFSGNEVPFYEAHIRRAQRHARLADIELSFPSKTEFEAILVSLAEKNGIRAQGRCRLSWFREAGGLYLPQRNTGTFLIELFSFDPASVKRQLQGIFYDAQPVVYGKFSPFKKIGAAAYTDAARHARQQGADEALLLNAHGRVAESVSGNVLVRKGNRFFAPPVSDGGVEGILLQYLEKELPGGGYAFERQSFTPEELLEADEILTVNALRGICCLILLGGKSFSFRSLDLNAYLPLGG